MIDDIFNFLNSFFKTLLFLQGAQLIISILESSVIYQLEIIFTFFLLPFLVFSYNNIP